LTARTRHGSAAHRSAHGADKGSTHEKLNRAHAQPNRPEGAPMSAAGFPSAAPPPGAPSTPQPQDNVGLAPPGGGMGGGMPSAPPMDPTEGDDT
jgi:hypothetical protein